MSVLVGRVSDNVTKLQTTLLLSLVDNRRVMEAVTLAHSKSRKDIEALRHDTNASLKRLEEEVHRISFIDSTTTTTI